MSLETQLKEAGVLVKSSPLEKARNMHIETAQELERYKKAIDEFRAYYKIRMKVASDKSETSNLNSCGQRIGEILKGTK